MNLPSEYAQPGVWVNVGEFWVEGVGLLRAYLPENPARFGTPDLNASSARYSIVHPSVRSGIAVVAGLDAEPVWEHRPDDWSDVQRSEIVEHTRRLRVNGGAHPW